VRKKNVTVPYQQSVLLELQHSCLIYGRWDQNPDTKHKKQDNPPTSRLALLKPQQST